MVMKSSRSVTASGGTADRPATAGQVRIEAAALRLFTEEGVRATSLQKIADEIGCTKAAVYWHYRSKDEIVLGVLKPALAELEAIVADAESRRGHRTRVEAALHGVVDLTVRHRQLTTLLLSNVTVQNLLEQYPPLPRLVERLADVLAGPDPDGGGRVAATLFLSGLSGATRDPGCAHLDDDSLRTQLLACGRRLLLARR
jgi:AcrR family transcriptional regulator